MLNKKEKDILYLVIKSDDEGILPENIAKELGISKEEVITILDSLEEKGFLYSEIEEED
ncbi:MAG: winged helix-turn-helix transcriptional regulator [Candidatus Lokiarchaeota archaeon]|nr:winged helix-turn-helix transcriptional regulator [Candidatus Lokiarchaeota archaeon]